MPWEKVRLHDGGFTYKWVEPVSTPSPTPTVSPTPSSVQSDAAAAAAKAAAIAAAAAAAAAARQIAAQKAAIEAAREKARNSAILAQRAAESRKRAAELAAYKKAQAEARAKAWVALRQKQIALVTRAGVIDSRVPPKAPTAPQAPQVPGDKYDRPKLTNPQLAAQMAEREAARQAQLKKEADAYAAEMAYQRERKRLSGQSIASGQTDIDGRVLPDKTGVKSTEDAQSAEKVLAEEKRRQSAGEVINPETLRALQQQYDKYATTVAESYVGVIGQLDELAKVVDDTSLTYEQRKAAYEKYVALYRGAYSEQAGEFQRLFGDGGLNQGAYRQFQSTSDQIALAQREWWKNQMKSSLQNEINQLVDGGQRFGEDVTSEVSLLQQQLAIAQEDPAALGRTIDHMETVVDENGNTVIKPVYRTKTIEEALQDQQAKMIAEQQKLWAQKQQQAKIAYLRQQNLMKTEGVIVGADGQLRDPQEEAFRNQLLADARSLWGTTPPSLTRAEDLQHAADAILRKWAERNPEPVVTGRSPANRQAWQEWKAKRDAYENQVYKFFGSETPGFLDRLLAAPVVSHLVAAFQGGTSAFGAGARVLLKVTTGSSTFELSVPIDAFPEHIRDAARIALSPAPGDLSYERVDSVRSLNEWLATPEGQAWAAKRKAEQAAQSQLEDSEFAKGFYGDDNKDWDILGTDFGSRLDALNKYGSAPFGDDAANLLYQLLVDPTNAIPLKFTTYLSRAKYASELAQGASKLNPLTWGKAVHRFLTVDEGILQLEKKLSKYADVLKKSGKTPEQAAEELRTVLAGVKEPSGLGKAYEEWARSVGLDPKQLAEGELFNIAEWSATKAAADNGTLFTRQKEKAAEFKAREAEMKAADKARLVEQKAAQKAVAEKSAIEAAEGRKAANRLAEEHAAAVKSQMEKADAAKARAAAAPEAVGKSPAPAKPKPARAKKPAAVPVSEPGQLTEKLREVHAPVQARARKSANYKTYEGFDEYYVKDAVGNYVPRDPSIQSAYMRSPEYKMLMKSAKQGSVAAREQLAYHAELMRNAFRTSAEDAVSVKVSKFTPSEFDVAERAAVLGDKAAEELLNRNRAAMNHVKFVAARGNADVYVAGFRQRQKIGGRAEAIQRTDALEGVEPTPDAISDALSGDANFRNIGEEVLGARDSTARGLHGLYDSFTHDSTAYYANEAYTVSGPLGPIFTLLTRPGWVVSKMSATQLAWALKNLDLRGGPWEAFAGAGAVAWRDGGQVMFEMFHQLRLGGAPGMRKLQEFSSLIDAHLVDAPDDVFAWQWKVMEYRTGMPWALSRAEVAAGFKDAAQAAGLDPDLAMASIPNGYRAQLPPVSFNLSPILRHMESSNEWLPAPSTWREKDALDTVTKIFERGVGEPMQVVHYVAKRFGDFGLASPVRNRLVGEVGLAATKALGVDNLASILARHLPPNSQLAQRIARNQALRDTPERVIAALLDKPQRRTAKGSFLRPEYPDLKEAIMNAYWAGELPLPNARSHQMMYLMHLQDMGRRSQMVVQTAQFMRYMRALGQEAETQAFLQRIHALEFENLRSRWRAEQAGRVLSKDPISGEAVSMVDSAEWKMWQDMGFKAPDQREIDLAIAKNRRELEEIEDQASRNADYVAKERDKPSDAYTGVIGDEQIEDLVAKIETARVASDMFGPLASLVKRLADSGGLLMSGGVEAEVASVIEAVRKMPGGLSVLRRVQDQIGEGVLAQRVAGSSELVAYREAVLRLRMRAMQTASGAVKPQFARAHTHLQLELEQLLSLKTGKSMEVTNPRKGPWGDPKAPEKISVPVGKSRRYNLDEMRDSYMAGAEKFDAPNDVKIEPVLPSPRVAARVDGQSALLDRLMGMREEEWWDYALDQSRRILRSKTASAERKAQARRRIADVELARYAREVDKGRGTFVSWEARADHQAAVLAKHGKDAEGYFRANMIAPYARDIYGATVEQTRTWTAQLRRAAAGAAPSRVSHLGPKFKALDYFPIEQFDEVEQAVAKAIHEARNWQADTLTRARGSRQELKAIQEDELAASRLVDKDPKVLAAKRRVLNSYGISMDAYDEARKVLWKGYVQRRTNQWLIDRTNKVVEAAKGLGVKDPSWDKAYKSVRDRLTREEARRQLGALAFGEMFGAEPQAIMDEFASRYGFDGALRDVRPVLSAFQRKTLEEAIAVRSGGMPLNDFLQSANRPPFEQGREAVREHLKATGAWSPRKADEFTLGQSSWSITDEAEYWETNFGFVPDWTNPGLLRGDLREIFHDPELYYLQMQEWGVFNRAMDLKLRLSGTSAKAIEDARVHGDPALNIPGRRELEEQRRFAVERYGDLVGVMEGGQVRLTAMPWLMYPDEKLRYLASRASDGLPEGLIQSADELNTVLAVIEKHMKPLMDKMIELKAGAPIMYEDIYRVSARVQAELLADPFWRKRMRDRLIGDPLGMWTKFNRWMIFSNPSFGVMNIIDVPIKTALYRQTRRGLFNPGLHGIPDDVARRAAEMTPAHLGLDAETTIYYRKQRSAAEYFTNPRKEIRIGPVNVVSKPIVGLIESIEGAAHFIPETAGNVELKGKMHLARGMYPQVYARALQRLGDPDLADVWAKNFIKEEVSRFWPTAGDGPFERLFNRIVPFGSYMVRNKVLFLSEALGHPSLINKIEYIGRAIEQHNLAEWEQNHPGEVMPEYLRRRIELPWAPGYFLDLGQFSDATRGLKPLYTMGDEKTVMEFASEWVRLINPSTQALLYMVTNKIGLTTRIQYVPVLDENGFPTGQYEKVVTGWTEPWSKNQPDLGSAFWFVDALYSMRDLGMDGWTAGEVSQMLGQAFLFNAVSTYDRGTALFAAFKALQAKDKEAAQRWLDGTLQGEYLKDWLAVHAKSPDEVMNVLQDISRAAKTAQWADWFSLSAADRTAITEARAKIEAIRDGYAVKLSVLTPGSEAYREMKAQMYYAINGVYMQTPALMKEEVWSKTPAEWAERTASWQTDKLMDDFMALSADRPQRTDYATTKEYQSAVAVWEASKRLFLKTYPEVEKRLSSGIAQLDAVREQQNAEWSRVLDRIAARNEAIADAKADLAAGLDAQNRLDILYAQNDLDYSILNRDYAATYFAPEDYVDLPGRMLGPETLRSGVTLQRVTLLNDFSMARYEKALRDGTLDDFLSKEQYGKDMKAAISFAKGGDPFGDFNPGKFYKYLQDHPDVMEKYFANNDGKKAQWADSAAYVAGIKAAINAANASGKFDPGAFVAYLKARPDLLEAYFKRHPEKRAQWAKTDAYIKHISLWGKLVSASRWDEAKVVWDNLPKWVKDQYYAKHPEKAAKAAKTAEYLGFMKTWVSYFDSGDKNAAMDYFKSMPQWVKDRYYEAHPDKKVQYETSAKMFDKLKNYFAADPGNQSVYLANNPDLARWLAQNATDSDKTRFIILAAYQAIPKDEAWLRRVFREKYPEIFSQEALGERKLRRIAATLAERPEMSASFEQWVKTVMGSYYEMLRLGQKRPLNSFITSDREVPGRKKRHRSLSAEQTSQK